MSFLDLKFKKDRVKLIREKLAVDKNWATAGLVRIFENQTADEQTCEDTINNNGIGFTPADAYFLTSLAKQYISKRFLSSKQMTILFKKMPKYSAQLERFSTGAK